MPISAADVIVAADGAAALSKATASPPARLATRRASADSMLAMLLSNDERARERPREKKHTREKEKERNSLNCFRRKRREMKIDEDLDLFFDLLSFSFYIAVSRLSSPDLIKVLLLFYSVLVWLGFLPLSLQQLPLFLREKTQTQTKKNYLALSPSQLSTPQSFSRLYPRPVWDPSKCTASAWYFLSAGLCATESVVIPASAVAA